ncbi:hypothetical protein M9H77_27109 [Catharanthus roseus]|uniref:Uncharacterized protein n=1 Tax=Catharanthus roseus TaxID=4058 RepID=A0ACC0AC40_CATRO|nr:hypothetical protein M9H77_27109 [Catharanthus roseus]
MLRGLHCAQLVPYTRPSSEQDACMLSHEGLIGWGSTEQPGRYLRGLMCNVHYLPLFSSSVLSHKEDKNKSENRQKQSKNGEDGSLRHQNQQATTDGRPTYHMWQLLKQKKKKNRSLP